MTEQEQRVAIARLCNISDEQIQRWIDYEEAERQFRCAEIQEEEYYRRHLRVEPAPTLPDYPHDLNAMHLAELACLSTGNNRLNPDEGEESDWDHYIWELERIVGRGCAEEEIYAFAINSTAAQRAEAFLRTVGKWREE